MYARWIGIVLLAAAAVVDVSMLVHLSKLYGLPLNRSEAGELVKTIGAQMLLLMGTVWAVHLVGSALKLGGLAAVAGLAYKAYQNWRAGSGAGTEPMPTPVDQLSAVPAEARSQLLLEAMIMAANADGHIDASERVKIEKQVDQLGLEHDMNTFIHRHLAQPAGVSELAARVDSVETAAEVYLVSRLIIDTAATAERRYLDALVAALGLQLFPDLAFRIGAEPAAAWLVFGFGVFLMLLAAMFAPGGRGRSRP